MTQKIAAPRPVAPPAAPSTIRPGTPVLPAPGTRPPTTGPRQVSPARSATEMAARALNASRRQQEASAASGIHSAKLHALLRGDRRNDALLARAFVGRLAKAQLAAKDPGFEQLLLQFGDTEDVDDLLAALDKAELHPAAMALVLAAMAQQHRPGRRRSRLEAALDQWLEGEEDWRLEMLGWLEFGNGLRGELRAQLKTLYQNCSAIEQGLASFFAGLLGIGERRRKIKVLIRALGAELGGSEDERAEGTHLAAVVRDLKRLLIFLGFEEQCGRIAHGLGPPEVDGDLVLRFLLELIDQSWLYADWLEQGVDGLELGQERGYRLMRELAKLCKLLPEPCYRDEDHRQQVLTVLQAYNDRAENPEPAAPEGESGH
ncbi:TyeA family type III secretion system gatekeeper subunit [Cupriavidus sp. AU9028]|uniref:TyeA family type III secretion system gatekeeper subunit n=1 Tax=Cupriavidus sp. AU9028 TaxID=2871157 RepID=UPI001C952A71|nr:TyeA family type III secretion system gatekeeper subunit [Cupriavidus sp. AU9028]MBY4897874.1 TyeA family type III secretion system gatekeeper subunit [Cupriavidus sp. AU9028]